MRASGITLDPEKPKSVSAELTANWRVTVDKNMLDALKAVLPCARGPATISLFTATVRELP